MPRLVCGRLTHFEPVGHLLELALAPSQVLFDEQDQALGPLAVVIPTSLPLAFYITRGHSPYSNNDFPKDLTDELAGT